LINFFQKKVGTCENLDKPNKNLDHENDNWRNWWSFKCFNDVPNVCSIENFGDDYEQEILHLDIYGQIFCRLLWEYNNCL